MSWPSFNIRDLLIATALVGIGVAWPIFLIVIVPIIVAGILARMRLREPLVEAVYICASLYPLVWLSLVYLMWAVAWQVVGHLPSPGNDDPDHISPFVSSLYGIAAVMFFVLPVAFLFGIASLGLIVEPRSPSPKPTLITRGIIFLCVWIACFLWAAADPGQAIEWFFD
jgi:hypothetical protein